VTQVANIGELTGHMYTVARRTVDGFSRADIAKELGIALKYVEKLRGVIYMQFGVSNSFELAELVPDARLHRPKRPRSYSERAGVSMRHDQILILVRVLAAAEMGQDVRVMARDPVYRKARQVLARAAETARRRIAASEKEAV
jgi:DNA-binding CsgD family transcriptional regulator